MQSETKIAKRPTLTALFLTGILLMDPIIARGRAYRPTFAEPIVNLTIPTGRDATFRCYVDHLGGYRVGWVKADTKAIQAIHDHVITHNRRISVTHHNNAMWNLHIKQVQLEDSGQYMCQINTDPMISQMGTLDVVVSPDFDFEETSSDIMVSEGGTVQLVCKATGRPEPTLMWRREDGGPINIRDVSGKKTKVQFYKGAILLLVKVSRSDMGAYMCVASNGVPPVVSKRVMVSIHFHPIIHVPNQLVGAPLGTDVTLECNIEASPKSINYWVHGDNGDMIIPCSKYDVKSTATSHFQSKSLLTIRKLEKIDMGTYQCLAKNSLGEVESTLRLYEIQGQGENNVIDFEENDYDDQFGSAEHEKKKEKSNRVLLHRDRAMARATQSTPRDSLITKGNTVVDPSTPVGNHGLRVQTGRISTLTLIGALILNTFFLFN